MDMNELLDRMSSDTQSLLGSDTLTFERIEPAGPLDPTTFQRTENTQDFDAPAVTGEPVATREPNSGTRVTLSTFIVRVADCDFRPTPQGYFTDASGQRWRIITVVEQQDGREYLITAQFTK